jgi:hypothetical protein
MLSTSSAHSLRSGFQGAVIAPGDSDYDEARAVFNAAIDRRPALIARCATARDVSAALAFARQHGLVVAVRATGHNVAGFAVCDGGLVVDLSRMKRITVDPAARTVRAEAGCNWGEVNDALQPHGLAATGGFVSVTGVAGLTLGGGLGWLVRKHGLALDNLLAADVVLADGRAVTASARENSDLFWAIRGGGGNFGIVTSFEFRVHPAGTVLAGIVLHPLAGGAGALRAWRDFEGTAPVESNMGALLFTFPDEPEGPPFRGTPVVGLGGVYCGDIATGARVVAPLRAYGPPMVDLFKPTPYNEAQRMADFLWPPRLYNYWKSSYLTGVSDAAIDTMLDWFARVPSRHTVLVLEHNGDSAYDEVPESATAYGHRRWPFNMVITSGWSDPADADRNIAWTRGFFDAMRPFRADAAYVNYLADEGPDAVRAAYGAKLTRLATLKAKYDPENVFRLNQNIQPAQPA